MDPTSTPRINYVIATYGGNYHPHDHKEWVLNEQLFQLYRILRAKRWSNMPCLIAQVTIVVPPVREKPWLSYYNKGLWEYIFARQLPHVALRYMSYEGANRDASYDQWIQAHETFPQFDYELLMEDDYCMATDNPMFDFDLVRVYKQHFPKGYGYLASAASRIYGLPFHAAASIGIVSSRSYDMVKQASRKSLIQAYRDTNASIHQVKFSLLFTENSVPLHSMDQDYVSLFWNGSKKIIDELSEPRSVPGMMFVPIQMYTNTNYARPPKVVGFYFGEWTTDDEVERILHYAIFNNIFLHNRSILIISPGFQGQLPDVAAHLESITGADNEITAHLAAQGCHVIYTISANPLPSKAIFRDFRTTRHDSTSAIPQIFFPQVTVSDPTILRKDLGVPEGGTLVGVNVEKVDKPTRELLEQLLSVDPHLYVVAWGNSDNNQFSSLRTKHVPELNNDIASCCDVLLYTGEQQELLLLTSRSCGVVSKNLNDSLLQTLGEAVSTYGDLHSLHTSLRTARKKVPYNLATMYTPENAMVLFRAIVL